MHTTSAYSSNIIHTPRAQPPLIILETMPKGLSSPADFAAAAALLSLVLSTAPSAASLEMVLDSDPSIPMSCSIPFACKIAAPLPPPCRRAWSMPPPRPGRCSPRTRSCAGRGSSPTSPSTTAPTLATYPMRDRPGPCRSRSSGRRTR